MKKNPDRARRYYIAAAKNGDRIAQYTLAEHFLESRHAKNKKLGLIWLKKSVGQNNPKAQVKLAELYANSKLVGRDLDKARELLSLAMAQGYVPAMFKMGEIAYRENQYQLAKNWYTKAAKKNNASAQMALANLYLKPKSSFYDPGRGFLWMLKAAQHGSRDAQLALAKLYEEGKIIVENENLAKEWKKKATKTANRSSAVARKEVAHWLSNGKASTILASGYGLKGIFSAWQNVSALRENNYNQPPQLEVVTRELLYKPQFVMVEPNDIVISEYYDALARTLGHLQHSEIKFPRYALPSGNHPQEATAFEPLRRKAILGNASAQFILGQLYQDGVDVEQNTQEAIRYYELAARQNDLRAQYHLGLLYLEGKGIQPDYQMALSWLREAAFKGNVYAEYVLARLYEQGYQDEAGHEVIKPNREQSIALYYLASANHYGPAEYRLAEILVRDKPSDMSMAAKEKRHRLIKKLYQGAVSNGIKEAALPLAFFNAMDMDKAKQAHAFAVAKQEASQGNTRAALLLGLMFDRGIGVSVDRSEALSWYQKAPSNPVSDFILGTYWSQGIVIHQDIEKGIALLEQSADAGFSYANLNLAIMKQQQGEAFVTDLDTARKLGNSTAGLLLADYYLSLANDDEQMKQARDIYQYFAEKGDKEGQLKLAFMFEQGLGGAVDRASAQQWYGLAAEQGQAVAQYLLGRMHQLGWLNNRPDYTEAKKWYELAKTNYSPAAVALGFIYDTVDDDYKNAFAGYQLAAQQNDPIGQFNLGLIFEEGKGHAVDFEKARELYLQAAQRGHPQAMVQLAGLYFTGQVGSRDEQKALHWYKKAAALGDREALYQLGLLSETGVATKLDFPQALDYYQRAAQKGNAKAMFALARMYQYGLGVEKDNRQAAEFYKELALLDNPYAQYQLATFYYEGTAGERRLKEGKRLLLKAQENGSQQARRVLQWLEAQAQENLSYIEPVTMKQAPVLSGQSADRMYMNALQVWNRGDEELSRMILDRIMIQFPHYIPAKRAYEQLGRQRIGWLGSTSA